MPSLAVVACWIVVMAVTIAVRILLGRMDDPEWLAENDVAHTLWRDDRHGVAPTRVAVIADRLHLRAPHRRLVTLKPDGPQPTATSTNARASTGSSKMQPPAANSLTGNNHSDTWRVEIAGRASALFDEDSLIESALVRQHGNPPRRMTFGERFFLHAPRWTLSVMAGSLALGLGMTVLAATGESHPSKVTRIITSDDSYECVLDWEGSRAEGPHITECPDDDLQRVGDVVDAVRLPASDYVVARDQTHLTYVAFLAFLSAAALALLALLEVVWRLVLPRRVGTYRLLPRDDGPQSRPLINEHSVLAEHEHEQPGLQLTQPNAHDAVQPADDPQSLLTPQAWLPYAPDQPRWAPAHASNWRRRCAWRWHTLSMPWISLFVVGMATYHRENFQWSVVLMIWGGIRVLLSLIRIVHIVVAPRLRPDPQAPRASYSYVRIPDESARKKSWSTPLLVFQPTDQPQRYLPTPTPIQSNERNEFDEENGAWMLTVDGAPAPAGTLTLVGDLNNVKHRRVSIDGVEYEIAGQPEWLAIDELEFVHDSARHTHQANSL